MSFRATETNVVREPITVGTAVVPAYLTQDATSGVWGFTTNSREAEAGFVADAGGVLGIDDAVVAHEAGLTVLARGSAAVIAYTAS